MMGALGVGMLEDMGIENVGVRTAGWRHGVIRVARSNRVNTDEASGHNAIARDVLRW